MSDLGLVRYLGYAELPEAAALQRRLEAEQREHLANGVHLIVVQQRRRLAGRRRLRITMPPTPDPFAPEAVDELILDEYAPVVALPRAAVVERWTGTYASAPDRLMLVDAPSDGVRIVIDHQRHRRQHRPSPSPRRSIAELYRLKETA